MIPGMVILTGRSFYVAFARGWSEAASVIALLAAFLSRNDQLLQLDTLASYSISLFTERNAKISAALMRNVIAAVWIVACGIVHPHRGTVETERRAAFIPAPLETGTRSYSLAS